MQAGIVAVAAVAFDRRPQVRSPHEAAGSPEHAAEDLASEGSLALRRRRGRGHRRRWVGSTDDGRLQTAPQRKPDRPVEILGLDPGRRKRKQSDEGAEQDATQGPPSSPAP